MVTKKLYYQEPSIRSFSAQILHSKQDANGRFYVVLDKTAFYPTGGGQPHDTGTINDVRVYNVEEKNGEIRHYTDTFLEAEKCAGEIDWGRRFDHMQQHTGQHILSAAFENMYGYRTVSFHLGTETCSIDLEISGLYEEEASGVEEKANDVILENRPIQIRWVTEDELNEFPLRKDVSVSENIRLVIIPDFDYNGCGGTHPNATGQVGSIKLLHWERQKKNIRVHFVCGTRVLKQLQDKHRVIQGLTSLLNAPQQDLKASASHILEQQKNLEKTNEHLQAELLLYEAQRLIKKATVKDTYKLVNNTYKDTPVKKLQQMAANVAQNANKTLVLFINENETKIQVVCARSNDIDMNMKDFITQILPMINGKGGGSKTIAQGGGDKRVSPGTLMEELIRVSERQLVG
ncbi:alanyl-tRNA editing protein [Virgibacillus ihumii]|uniref:alanyl-tRNA editing protein n=1 Tax=Virgibacillus ihumii TaxID=2686091 RepID=UPI00157D6CC6|nr:DHHA1 domain-containing protein [Virgibacillus ihumii]